MCFISDKSKYSCCYKHAYWEVAGLPVLPVLLAHPSSNPFGFPYWVNCPSDCVYKTGENYFPTATILKYPLLCGLSASTFFGSLIIFKI